MAERCGELAAIRRTLEGHEQQISALGRLSLDLARAHLALKTCYGDLLDEHRALARRVEQSGHAPHVEAFHAAAASRVDLSAGGAQSRSFLRLLATPCPARNVALASGSRAARCLLWVSRSCMMALGQSALQNFGQKAQDSRRPFRCDTRQPSCSPGPSIFQRLLQGAGCDEVMGSLVSVMDLGSIWHLFSLSRASRECFYAYAREIAQRTGADGISDVCESRGFRGREQYLGPSRPKPPWPPGARLPLGGAPAAARPPAPPAPSSPLCGLLELNWRKASASQVLARALGKRSAQRFGQTSRPARCCMQGRRRRLSPAERLLQETLMAQMAADHQDSSPAATPTPDETPPPTPRCRAAASTGSAARAAAEEADAEGAQQLATMARPGPSADAGDACRLVRLVGLCKRADLNGSVAMLVSCPDTRGRVRILLKSGEGLLVRGKNVELLAKAAPGEASPQPQPELPSLTLEGTSVLFMRGVREFAGARAAYACAAVSSGYLELFRGQGKLYVCGGQGSAAGVDYALDSVSCLDLTTRRWLDAEPMAWPGTEAARLPVVHVVPRLDAAGAVVEGELDAGRLPRQEAASVVSQGLLYVAGGAFDGAVLNSFERFDPRSGTWTLLPPMKTCRTCACMAAMAGRIYVCGGSVGNCPLSLVECFDPLARTWHFLPSMEFLRACPVAGAFNGQLYVLGGTDGKFLASMESFEVETRRWKACQSMSTARTGCATVLLGRHWYVLGGCSGPPLRSAERYDLQHHSWQDLPPMQRARIGAAAAVQRPSRVFACGGSGDPGASAEVFDVRTWSWEAVEPPLFSWCFGSAVPAAGSLYVCGGVGRAGASGSVQRLDLRKRTWDALPALPEPRVYSTAFVSLA